jgi:peroxiredoxin
MTRLTNAAPAPVVEATTLDGTHVRLPKAGEWTLLSFLRYASCPMCNLRVRELGHRREEFGAANVAWFAVFHSPERRLKRFMPADVWPHIVPDDGRTLYRTYGAERSWSGLLLSMLVPSFYWRFAKTLAYGYWGGAIDHAFHSMPADFLVSPDGFLRVARYGKHIGDHLDVSAVLEVADA